MKFAEKIENIQVSVFREGIYQEGFFDALDEAANIAEKADLLITKLFDALCNRHADDLVDELKEEFGL
jgi:hypothetical protein